MAGLPTMNFASARYRYATNVKWGNGYDPKTDMKYLKAQSVEDALLYYGCIGAGITTHTLQVRCSDGVWRYADNPTAFEEEQARREKREAAQVSRRTSV